MCETYLGGDFFAVRVSIFGAAVPQYWVRLSLSGGHLLIPCAMLAYRSNVDDRPGRPL
jgi:hypothetical protein